MCPRTDILAKVARALAKQGTNASVPTRCSKESIREELLSAAAMSTLKQTTDVNGSGAMSKAELEMLMAL